MKLRKRNELSHAVHVRPYSTVGGLCFGISPTDLADSAQVPRVHVQVPKSNEAKLSWTWGLGLGRGGLELKLHKVPTTDSSQV